MNRFTRIIRPKSEDLVVSNLLQLREIEAYHKNNPSKTLNEVAIEWIDRNSARWRGQHPLVPQHPLILGGHCGR